MDSIKYYVLWRQDNEVLEKYLNLYYEKLRNLLKDFKKRNLIEISDDFINNEANKYFILSPDISSIINSINRSNKNYNDIQLLKTQIDYYLNEKYDKLTMNMWDYIWWTDIKLTNYDNNPYNTVTIHPNHKDYWPSWGDLPKEKWLETYSNVFELLKNADEWIYDELNFIIKKIVPIWTHIWVHNSASYKECVGHLYMWYTKDANPPELPILEAIIHESSHNKLNLILQSEDLIYNDNSLRYYSPYRPDARHIHWIYLWVHAFAPTIYVLMNVYLNWWIDKKSHWSTKLSLYHLKNKYAMSVLKRYWKFSDLWNEILDEVKYVIDITEEKMKEIPKESKDEARLMFKQHLKDVLKNYPYTNY